MRSDGTAKELEARRRLGVRRVEDGWTQREAAAFLGVDPVPVGKWVARFRAAGEDGLAAVPTPGRPPFPTPAQEETVLGWPADPPATHGFRTAPWTARRVAEVIHKRPNVRFHPRHPREGLAKRNHSPRKPARRAKRRNPAEIDRWAKEDRPRIQKKSRPGGPTSSRSTGVGRSSTRSSAGRGHPEGGRR